MATSSTARRRPRGKTKSQRKLRNKAQRSLLSKPRGEKKPRLSRTKRPAGMSLEDWQLELRRQFGREQDFELANVGDHPLFSEFRVTNPKSKSTYRVAIRGLEAGENYCSCPDFATNALGTCKHVEFTLARLQTERGGKQALTEGYEPPYSEVYLQYGTQRRVKFRPGSECPAELARLAEQYFDDERVLEAVSFARFDEFLSQAGACDHELRCYDDVLALVAEVRDAAARRAALDAAFPDGVHSAAFRDLLTVELYPYQRQGALFAARAGRCLLADEMGLGKTVQAIAAAEILARHGGVERVLVVCPTSLKHQWEREIERFTGRVAQVVGGSRPSRAQQFAEPSFFKIINYDTVHRDLDLIEEWSPDLLVLDEAQRIKNWETRVARGVKRIRAPHCIVLTGTPIENRLEELVSIVQLVDQHRLGPTFRFLDRHQQREDSGRVVGYRNLDEIQQTLEPILLRRRKAEVLDQLPQRLDKRLFVPMTQEQWEYHRDNADTVARVVQKWRKLGFLSEADQRRLMIALQYMRMSCNSTYLIDPQTDFGHKADELATILDETLEEKNAKAVVFSQWTRTHELIQRRLASRPYGHVFFHGGVPGPKRKSLIDQFRDDPKCRVFLSTDAGGVGLNLQFASSVAVMDLPWNPAVLEQRIGRVHRLGQSQPVRVVQFVARQTIEESMLSVLSFKQGLFAGVLDGGETEVFLGQGRLGKFMETVDELTGKVPRDASAPDSDGYSPVPHEAEPQDADEVEDGSAPATGLGQGRRNGKPQARSASPPPADALAGLFQAGMALLQHLAGTSAPPASRAGGRDMPTSAVQVARDPRSGRPRLQIELPEADVIERVLDSVKSLLEKLRP